MLKRLLLLLLLLAGAALAAPVAYTPVTPGYRMQFPRDFGAHPDFHTEWWYVTGWLKQPNGKPLGFQVTFFRSATQHDRANPSAFAPTQIVIAHAALSDPAVGHLLHDQRSARAGLGLAYTREGDTDVKLGDWSMKRRPDGSYGAVVRARDFTLNLRLNPSQPPLLQGENGFSRKGAAALDASYYYSHPHLQVSGSVTRGGATAAVTGSAWLDHEWSSQYLDPDAAGWDWLGANLDDGSALMAFQMRSKRGDKLWAHATLRDASGRITQYDGADVSYTATTRWRSPRTQAEYPVAGILATGSTRWRIVPLQPDQELDSRRSTGAVYWEGAVTLERDGQPVGHGYLELTGYVAAMKM